MIHPNHNSTRQKSPSQVLILSHSSQCVTLVRRGPPLSALNPPRRKLTQPLMRWNCVHPTTLHSRPTTVPLLAARLRACGSSRRSFSLLLGPPCATGVCAIRSSPRTDKSLRYASRPSPNVVPPPLQKGDKGPVISQLALPLNRFRQSVGSSPVQVQTSPSTLR